MFIRIEELEIVEGKEPKKISITEFQPAHIQSGKFDKWTQDNFDEMLINLKSGNKITIEKIKGVSISNGNINYR